MSFRRLRAVFLVLIFCIGVVLCRVYWVGTDTRYAARAEAQTELTLELPRQRGNFYDRTGRLLTGAAEQWYALCVPGSDSYAALLPYVSYTAQAELYRRRNSTELFLIPVDRDLANLGVTCYRLPRRSLPQPIAVHLLGYLDGEGHGVTGLERAYDDILGDAGDVLAVSCAASAGGQPIAGNAPALQTLQNGSGQGITLTLDAELQRLCEGVAGLYMTRGCILIMEPASGRILASVSVPAYDPDHVAQSIAANDTSLINRAFAPFTVGSVFKLVAAAAAYDAGLDWFTADCTGSVEVDGQSYRCAQGRAHGEVNLRQALAQSCNCYFVKLGQALGGARLLQTARQFGFGQGTSLAPGLQSAAGVLPTETQLQSSGNLALFSFGQGSLTATPLQITAMVNTLAGDGVYHTPVLVQGLCRADGTLADTEATPAEARTVCTPATARVLRSMLHTVVEQGIGSDAMTGAGESGGKTGTAQTGQFDADGTELLNYWFSGFYPAENPQFTITVLQDGLTEPAVSSAAVFAAVVQGLHAAGYTAAGYTAAKNS